MHIAICDDDSRLAAEPNGWSSPPAALDPVSEYEVYRCFRHISGGRTSV